MQQDIITPEDGAWEEVLLRGDYDFYHLPCYQRLSAQTDEQPRALLVQDRGHQMLIPYLQRPIPAEVAGEQGFFDTVSPYGYPGPIVTRDAPAEFIKQSIAAAPEMLAAQGIVAGFFRLHTLLNDPAMFRGVGEIINHGPSVYIDLTHSSDELWAQTRRGHRRDLTVLEKRGYAITMDDWSRLDDFLTCYYDSMRRLGASPFYFFPKSYFEALRSCLGEDRIHLCLVHLDGDIACAGIVTEINGLCQYHLSATADPHFQDHPSKLMLHHLRGWLKARGNRIYHVGGGVGALRDSLHLFKQGFSPYAADFYTWRLVPEPERYRILTARWTELSGREPVDREIFFPQYRAPLSS